MGQSAVGSLAEPQNIGRRRFMHLRDGLKVPDASKLAEGEPKMRPLRAISGKERHASRLGRRVLEALR